MADSASTNGFTDHWQGRIVVGTDGSPGADAAVEWAVREAADHGRDLTLARAVPVPIIAAGIGPVGSAGLEVTEQLRAAALAEMHAKARSVGVPDAQVHVEVGSPVGMLLEASRDAALIVVGSRGLGGFMGLLLGSTAAQIGPHAGCPVVVVRGQGVVPPESVVVGVDGSEASLAAVAFAFAEASRHRVPLTVVHAWELPTYDLLVVPDDYYPWSIDALGDDERRLASEVLAGFRTVYPDVEVRTIVARGRAADVLVNAVGDSAILVVGTHGRGPVMGAVLGSVSHAVLHRAAGPVAIVPPKGPEWS